MSLATPFGHALLRDMPAPLTDLLGRDTEVKELCAWFEANEARVIVLTGTAGVGKSALALHVAHRLSTDFAGDILFVRLADIKDPELIEPTVARRLDVSPTGAAEDVRNRFLARLRERPFLLILDNLEHLLAARPALASLLEACPDLRLFVTSRAALRISGERIFAVQPLPPPGIEVREPSHLMTNSAVALFIKRAQDRGAARAVLAAQIDEVAAICRHLDGLPLSIELAAAHARTLPPATLRPKLTHRLSVLVDGPPDLPPRLQSLERAVDWSYELLEAGHQQLLRRLSVFEGGISLHAAEAIVRGWSPVDGYPLAGDWETDPQPWWIGNGHEAPADDGTWTPVWLPPLEISATTGLEALVDHSLLRPMPDAVGEARFEMLETIREFALARLKESGEVDAVRHAHAVYFVTFAEACGLGLWRSNQRRWALRLEADLGNVRAARDWLATQPGAANQLSLRIAESLWPFWQTRGGPCDGFAWLTAALAREGGSPKARINAMNRGGLMAWYQGEDARAQTLLDHALLLSRAIDYRVETGRNLFVQALIAWRRGDLARMDAFGKAAIEDFMAWENPADIGMVLIMRAVVARERGALKQAERMLDEAIGIFGPIDFPWGIAAAKFYAGEVAHDLGEVSRAADLLGDALTRFWQLGDLWGVSGSVAGLALLAEAEPARAARLLGVAKAQTARVGTFLPPTEDERYAKAGARLSDVLGTEEFGEAFRNGLGMTAEDIVVEANELASRLAYIGSANRSPSNTSKMVVESKDIDLRTAKEIEVVRLLAAGWGVKEIAADLDRSPNAIYDRLTRLKKKLGVSSDAEVAIWAERRHLI